MSFAKVAILGTGILLLSLTGCTSASEGSAETASGTVVEQESDTMNPVDAKAENLLKFAIRMGKTSIRKTHEITTRQVGYVQEKIDDALADEDATGEGEQKEDTQAAILVEQSASSAHSAASASSTVSSVVLVDAEWIIGAEERNKERQDDINDILRAFWAYADDHVGKFQPDSLRDACTIPTTGDPARNLCTFNVRTKADEGTTCMELGCVYTRHLAGKYLGRMPSDPRDQLLTRDNVVDYKIVSIPRGGLRVTAPNAENDLIIEVTR